MEIFMLTLKQMLMMFFLILVGFFLRRKKLLPENSDSTMAKLETYIFLPALNLGTQIAKCTVETFRENSVLILYGLVLNLIAILISYPLSKLFVREKSKSPDKAYLRNVYKYALTYGNYGFVGNFIILGVWGNDMFFKYTMLTFFLTILCNSWGLYVLVPKEHNAGLLQNLKKGLLSPPLIAVFAGIIIGLFGFSKYVPEFIVKALDSAASCQGPVAMLLAGVVIGGFKIKDLLFDTKIYIVTALRLIIIPAVIMIVLKLFGVSKEIMTLALIAFATPLGMNTIVFPAAYGGDTKPGAAMITISSFLAVITIPLMYLVFIVLL